MPNRTTNFPEHPTLSTMWMNGVKQMDPQAWSRLVTVFGPIVYRWCRVSGVPASNATDVVQEVFTSVAMGVPDFERRQLEGSFRSWLAAITRTRVADYFRCAAKQQEAVGGTAAMLLLQQQVDNVESTINPARLQSLISKQLLEHVRSEFEPITWEAFWQTTIEGRTATDVSESTGLSRASVYQAKSRVLKALRRRLTDPLA